MKKSDHPSAVLPRLSTFVPAMTPNNWFNMNRNAL